MRRDTRGSRHSAWWLLLALLPAYASAQSSGGQYVMRKQVVAAGVRGQGAPFVATGTAAQPIAWTSSGGNYKLTGGFWQPTGQLPILLLCDGFENTPCP